MFTKFLFLYIAHQTSQHIQIQHECVFVPAGPMTAASVMLLKAAAWTETLVIH